MLVPWGAANFNIRASSLSRFGCCLSFVYGNTRKETNCLQQTKRTAHSDERAQLAAGGADGGSYRMPGASGLVFCVFCNSGPQTIRTARSSARHQQALSLRRPLRALGGRCCSLG